jgi:radical SAM protein with 4Fe4S-binding SPASM domain
VQFPWSAGNVRKQRFLEIWRCSTQLNELRSIRARDLPVCSTCSHLGTCTRCPGLVYLEGNLRGPSAQDCEKSYARTGIFCSNMLAKMSAPAAPSSGLAQVAGIIP